MRPLRGLQEIPVATREESRVLRFPSRQGLTPRAPAACSFPGENARSWEALGEARCLENPRDGSLMGCCLWGRIKGSK